MSWTFHSAEGSAPGHRVDDEHVVSHIKNLEDREAELVRCLLALKERRAFFPNEVTEGQVKELAARLQETRNELDVARSVLPPHHDWA